MGPVFLFFFAACLFLIGPVEALRLKTNWGERVDLSERIVRGKILSVKSRWNPEKRLIYTDVIISVDEYLKGDGPKEIKLTIPGGSVGDKTNGFPIRLNSAWEMMMSSFWNLPARSLAVRTASTQLKGKKGIDSYSGCGDISPVIQNSQKRDRHLPRAYGLSSR